MSAAAIIAQRRKKKKFLKRIGTMNMTQLVGVMEDHESKKAKKVIIKLNKYQDANNYELAKQGYELASKFDPSNWVPYYLNGLIYFKEKKWLSQFQQKFLQKKHY